MWAGFKLRRNGCGRKLKLERAYQKQLIRTVRAIMNGYERYTGVLRGRPVDHLPRIPILMQYAAEYIGSDYAAFASDHRVLVEANARCATAFGIDQ